MVGGDELGRRRKMGKKGGEEADERESATRLGRDVRDGK